MVAGKIEKKIKSMTAEDLDAKIVQMLREAAHMIGKLKDDNARLREAVEQSHLALQDWLNQYASEVCDVDRVAQAKSRISNRGGTVAYITEVSGNIDAALKEPKEAAASP